MTTRKRGAVVRGEPAGSLLRLGDYCFDSCQRPLHGSWSLVLFVRATAALQSWSGGHCAAKMATRLVVLHRFEGLGLNAAIYIAGILLLAAALLGLAVGGFSAGRASHPVRPGPSGFPIRDKAARHFSLTTGMAAVGAAPRLGRWQDGWTGPFARHFVASLRPREPPASGAASGLAKHPRPR